MSLMGLDVGTTGVKAMAFTPEGKVLARAYREYRELSKTRMGRDESQ